MRNPTYHNPLLLPNVQHRNPLTLPNSLPDIPKPPQKKSSASGTKESSLPKVDGLIGQVNAWNQGIEASKSKMSSIISQYGMGNAAYAQRYDKEYQQANATLNALTSPAYLNQMKRYKRQRDNFEEHIDNGGKDRGEEFDLEHYRRTGQIRDFNYVLDAMEEDANFNFASHSDKPNLTTSGEAREMLYEFMNVKGYDKTKSQGRTGELKSSIVNGMMKYGTQAVGGRTRKSNQAAVSAAMKELTNYGIDKDIMSGLMRGFLSSPIYATVLKNFKGTGDVRKSAEYEKALKDYVSDEITLAGQKNLQTEDLAGNVSMSVGYRALPNDVIKARAMGVSIAQMYTGMAPGMPAQITRVSPNVNEGSPSGYSQRPGEWKPPTGATGQRHNYQATIHNTPESWKAARDWNSYITNGGKTTPDAAQVGLGSYYMDANTGMYWAPGKLKGWKVKKTGDYIMSGIFNPQAKMIPVKTLDNNGNEVTTYKFGGYDYKPRSESQMASAEQYAEYMKSQGNFVGAQQIGNMGAGVGMTLEMSKDDFDKWVKDQTVIGTANWEYEGKDASKINRDVINYYKSKGYRYSERHRVFANDSGNVYFKNAVNEYLQTKEGKKKYAGAKNEAAKRDFTKEKPLYGSGVGYNDNGIAIEYANSFTETTDADGNTTVIFNPVRGADDFLLSQPEVINGHLQNMGQYDQNRMNQNNEIETIFNNTPN